MKKVKSEKLIAGYVLDWEMGNASETDFHFDSDTTYHVTRWVQLHGTTVIDPRTVIKFDKAVAAQLIIDDYGGLLMRNEPYLPVIFTAKDDNSAGAVLSGSSGSPSGYYADPALGYFPVTALRASQLNIRYAKRGLYSI
jgi:hypothetical protein